MDSLEKAREALQRRLDAWHIDPCMPINVRTLPPDEAIGLRADSSFVIKRGKERLIEAIFQDHRGQAFTDQPASWEGTLEELIALDLEEVSNRAVFVAGLNALVSAFGEASGTVHCRDEDPLRCGPLIAQVLYDRFGPVSVGLIGLQPAIFRALVSRFGPSSVNVLDLDPENIGQVRSGVPIWSGETDLSRLVEQCHVGLATGSSVVNRTLDEILIHFRTVEKPLLLFGTTISGVASLLGLERLCPFGRSG